MKRDQSRWKFKLRDIVKDDVTGYEGVALGIGELETGCTYYGIAPQEVKDAKPAEWHWFDESRLVHVGHCDGYVPLEWDQFYNMHDVVKDTITGYTGTVMDITFYASGCLGYGVQAAKFDKGVPVPVQFFTQDRLAFVKAAKRAPRVETVERPPSPPFHQNAPSIGG